MADERMKVETELNQTGNAEQSLERTVGLLDRAIEAERKLAEMAGQAESAMSRLGGAAGGLSRADEAINRERSRSSPVGAAFGATLSRPSAQTERAYEAFRRDRAMVASATGLQPPGPLSTPPLSARRSATLDLTPPEVSPPERLGATLGQPPSLTEASAKQAGDALSTPALSARRSATLDPMPPGSSPSLPRGATLTTARAPTESVLRQPTSGSGSASSSDRAAAQLVTALLANTRATELNTAAIRAPDCAPCVGEMSLAQYLSVVFPDT